MLQKKCRVAVISLCCILSFLLLSVPEMIRTEDDPRTFVTGLDRASESVPDSWTFDSGLENVDELSFSNDLEKPGIVYREPHIQGEFEPANQSGQAQAWAPWSAESGPFEMSFKIRINRLTPLPDRNVGFFVGLSTGRPGKLSEEDVTISLTVNRTGILNGVVKGDPFRFSADERSAYKHREVLESKQYVWQQTKTTMMLAGGVEDVTLRYHVQRTESDRLIVTIFKEDVWDGTRPWWKGSWTIPKEVARVFVGGKEPSSVRVENNKKIQFSAPPVENPNQPYDLRVLNPGGLTLFSRKIVPYGRWDGNRPAPPRFL